MRRLPFSAPKTPRLKATEGSKNGAQDTGKANAEMESIEQEIIEAGYKELLKKNHPDRSRTERERAIRDEFCKSLAVARDKLTALATQSASVSRQPEPTSEKPKTAYTQSPPRPFTSEDLAQFLVDLGTRFIDEALGRPPQRRRAWRTRQ